MKICILFVALFSLLIVGINSEEVPKRCEDYFKVSTCNECQQELWNSWANPSSCGYFIRLIMNIMKNYDHNDEHIQHTSFNVTPYNDAVKETCDTTFSCNYNEAESLWKNVEKKCPTELSTKIDWSANPSSLDRTVTSAYATVLFLYFGIPDHDFMCFKSSSGELCGIEIVKPFMDWLKEKIPEGKFRLSLDNKFVYKEDGSRLEIPKELFSCSECFKKMIEIYDPWPVQHPWPDYIKDAFSKSWEDIKKSLVLMITPESIDYHVDFTEISDL